MAEKKKKSQKEQKKKKGGQKRKKKKAPRGKRKKGGVNVAPEGIAHIKTSFNNTIVTFTNKTGQTICWSSAGKLGFKGSKKNTPYAGQTAAAEAARLANEAGIRRVEVRVKGPGAGREAAVRSIYNEGIEVSVIKDVTPLPHNGCRPPKQRRV